MAAILYAEDDPDCAAVICTALRRAGYEVMHTDDGGKALAALESFSPDIFITDILMPEMHGVALIATARRLRPELPIVAISGGDVLGPTYFLHAAAKFGAGSVLTKPFTYSELLVAVATAERAVQS